MTSLGTLFNFSWWATYKLYQTSYWMVWGISETEEQKNIKETNQRLKDMEKKIEQMWALQLHLVCVDPNMKDIMSSVVVVEDDGTFKISPI